MGGIQYGLDSHVGSDRGHSLFSGQSRSIPGTVALARNSASIIGMKWDELIALMLLGVLAGIVIIILYSRIVLRVAGTMLKINQCLGRCARRFRPDSRRHDLGRLQSLIVV
jgi:hypothetical protein